MREAAQMENNDEANFSFDEGAPVDAGGQSSEHASAIEGGPDAEAARLLESLEVANVRTNIDLAEHFGEDIGGKVDAHKATLFGRINQRVEDGMRYLQEHDMLPKTKKGFWMLSAAAAPAIALLPGGVAIGAGLYKLYRQIDLETKQATTRTVIADEDEGWFEEVLHDAHVETPQTT